MNLIFEKLLKTHPIITVIGMAKNTGKTTTLNRLIAEAELIRCRIGLVSTGRDGESTDVFTGREKPRIYAQKGAYFAATEESLGLCEAKTQLRAMTECLTSIGKVVIAEVTEPGAVEICGPSSVDEMLDLVEQLRKEYGVKNVLIDGSINRIAIATTRLNAGVILATGAVLGDMKQVIEQTQLKVDLLQIQCLDAQTRTVVDRHRGRAGVLLIDKDRDAEVLDSSLLDNISGVVEKITGQVGYLYTSGSVTDMVIEELLKKGRAVEIIVEDASMVHISGSSYERWLASGANITAVNKLNLLAVTCNPHNPMGNDFEPKEFLEAMRGSLNVPVYDVMIN
jgi:hypothetical protein